MRLFAVSCFLAPDQTYCSASYSNACVQLVVWCRLLVHGGGGVQRVGLSGAFWHDGISLYAKLHG